MADGSHKNIEDIEVGESVKTFADAFDNRLYEGRVAKVWEHEVAAYLLINDTLEVTPEHPMYSNHRFIDAGLLKIGDWLLDESGRQIFIESIETIHKEVLVYNLDIEPYHTYIAGGFYVHNQEKGGGAREFFTDAALFETVQTGSNGRAETSFTLPDNITSWRVTSQAISSDLEAGVSVTKIPVSLPVFAEVSVDNEYLQKDRPVARLRAYGEALAAQDDVKFTISLLDDEAEEIPSIFGKAFSNNYYNIPELSLGKHEFVYSLETSKGTDAIKLPMNIIDSRLTKKDSITEKLSTATKVVAPVDDSFRVMLMDNGQSVYYRSLSTLSYAWGDRVDQIYTRKKARELINKYYEEDYMYPEFKADTYQDTSGGITLLPYSSASLLLSLQTVLLDYENFDKDSLQTYFLNNLNYESALVSNISYALSGLLVLKQPVLLKVNEWLSRDDLAPEDKVYLATALAKVGALDKAREIYLAILDEYGQIKTPHIIIKTSDNNDEVFAMTMQTAVLGALLEDERAEQMFDYVDSTQILYGPSKNSEELYTLQKLAYIEIQIAKLKPSPAKVEYELFGEKQAINISGGQTHSFILYPSEVEQLKFLSVEGDVSLTLIYNDDLDIKSSEADNSIGIERKYFVNGQETNTFNEEDRIEVRLYPHFAEAALSGAYEITDILPTGFAPITEYYYWNRSYDCHYWYPFNNDGQLLKYMIDKSWENNFCGDYIKYYVRVKNTGTFVAEPAIIQSFYNVDYINYSEEKQITIN